MLFCRSVRIFEPSIFNDSVSVQNTYPPMVNTNNYAESQHYQPNESFNDVPSVNFSTLSNDSSKLLLSYIDSSAIIHPFLNKIVWISSRSFYSRSLPIWKIYMLFPARRVPAVSFKLKMNYCSFCPCPCLAKA